QHAVAVGRDQLGVGRVGTVGSVYLQLDQQRGEHVLVLGLDLDEGAAGIDVGLPDPHVEHPVVGPGRHDGVHHLGQDERVDDVTFELDQLGRHYDASRL